VKKRCSNVAKLEVGFIVAYRGIIGDAGIVTAFDCLPHRLDQPKQPFPILPRHTALADKAAQRDQRDRFDAHLSRCRRVDLGLHGGNDLLLGRRRHLVSSSMARFQNSQYHF